MIKNIQVNSLGPIKEANIHFGDLTLFVGTQASGKSILLQLIKLMIDKSHIRKTLKQYGYGLKHKPQQLINSKQEETHFFGYKVSDIIFYQTQNKPDNSHKKA
jgi:predicted ATPase